MKTLVRTGCSTDGNPHNSNNAPHIAPNATTKYGGSGLPPAPGPYNAASSGGNRPYGAVAATSNPYGAVTSSYHNNNNNNPYNNNNNNHNNNTYNGFTCGNSLLAQLANAQRAGQKRPYSDALPAPVPAPASALPPAPAPSAEINEAMRLRKEQNLQIAREKLAKKAADERMREQQVEQHVQEALRQYNFTI